MTARPLSSPPALSIQRITPAELRPLRVLRAIRKLGFRQARSVVRLARTAGRRDWWLLLDGQLVGTVGLFRHARLGDWAVSVFVSPTQRGKQLARFAMASMGASFGRLGVPLLATVRDSNTPSLRTFERIVDVEPTTIQAADTGQTIQLFRIDRVARENAWLIPELVRAFEDESRSLTT